MGRGSLYFKFLVLLIETFLVKILYVTTAINSQIVNLHIPLRTLCICEGSKNFTADSWSHPRTYFTCQVTPPNTLYHRGCGIL